MGRILRRNRALHGILRLVPRQVPLAPAAGRRNSSAVRHLPVLRDRLQADLAKEHPLRPWSSLLMETLASLAGGFATALQPINIAMLFVGVLLGLVIGVLPGLGGTSGVAILLPVTVVIARGDLPGANATTAVILLAGI